MPVQMDLKRIIINEVQDQQVIILREVEGERSFPIVIGIFEATSIDRRVKGMPSPRPLTHDLVASVIEPDAPITEARAVGPSNHGTAKTRWSFAASVTNPRSAARRA